MAYTEEHFDAVLSSVKENLGDPTSWDKWPGGWPDDIETALVDAVFSARAEYKTKHGRGVHALVTGWRARRNRADFDLQALREEVRSKGPEIWASDFGSSQHSPGRTRRAAGGPTKAATVLEAADALLAIGIRAASDVTPETSGGARKALLSVDGIGYATANYFFMLLGAPGVKPDRMIHRFLKASTGRAFSNADAEEILRAVAGALGVKPNELEHTIWRFESAKARVKRGGVA